MMLKLIMITHDSRLDFLDFVDLDIPGLIDKLQLLHLLPHSGRTGLEKQNKKFTEKFKTKSSKAPALENDI